MSCEDPMDYDCAKALARMEFFNVYGSVWSQMHRGGV